MMAPVIPGQRTLADSRVSTGSLLCKQGSVYGAVCLLSEPVSLDDLRWADSSMVETVGTQNNCATRRPGVKGRGGGCREFADSSEKDETRPSWKTGIVLQMGHQSRSSLHCVGSAPDCYCTVQ
jgi:hypothetical protein